MTEEPGRPAVFARHASSLIVVQSSADGPAVLMGVRGAGHRFVPNRLVFPGGAVDPADRTARAENEPNEACLQALSRHAHPRLARAIAMAAARELHEETGLSLGSPPRLDGMHYLCRAITPPRQPIRFNARFLIVDADGLVGDLQDTRELHDTRYIPLEEALGIDTMTVTREVLGRLKSWLASDRSGGGVPGPSFIYRGERWAIDQPRRRPSRA